MKFLPVAVAGLLLVMPACAARQAVTPTGTTPSATTPVKDILYAAPFTLQTPYRNDWSKERAMASMGVLVVLEVDPAVVVPRDALEPVLYAGDVTVYRLNHGHTSGRVVGIIPGNVNLSTAPIWFGSPQLPERVTADMVRSERARAEKAGVRPFPAGKISGVLHPAVAAIDLAALLRDAAAQLIYQYSPQEKELADSWRLPAATASPKPRTP
jgi:hypothetical protein